MSSIYNGTYTLYRLSPLHHSASAAPLAEEAALIHARRLSDALKGDTLRGVKVSFGEDTVSATTGILKSCQWRSLGAEAVQGSQVLDALGFEGLQVDLNYGKNIYTALALRSSRAKALQRPGETYLPLLLTRMPPGIRDVLLDYLTTTFDTRIEPMCLSSLFMEAVLESCLAETDSPESARLEKEIKGIQLVLGFKISTAPELKSLAIDMKKEDVRHFLNRGKLIVKEEIVGRQQPGSGKDVKSNGPRGPFMASVRRYVEDQTAIDMGHASVMISKITCGAFVLFGDGKAKLVAASVVLPAEETQADAEINRPLGALVLEQLINRAANSS